MSLGSVFFLLAIAGLIIFFSPQLASGINTLRQSPEQKKKAEDEAALKQKQREDEGIFVTLGRIVLGDATLDQAKAKEQEQKNATATAQHLATEFSKDRVAKEFQGKKVLTDSEKLSQGIPLNAPPESDPLIIAQNQRQKKKRRSVFNLQDDN
jgi:hypothetical protein